TGFLREAGPALGQQEGVEAGLAGEGEELRVRDGPGEEAFELPEHQALIVVLEALEAREVVEGQNGEHLALRKGGPASGRMLGGQSFGQGVGSEISLYFLAEIIDETKHFYDLGSIYEKVHKAKGLGETSVNIST
uniref:hypothetical protein n=1 Tax=Pontibacter pamirensis TaxID=2562824 RepID=UPI00138A67EE